MSDCGTLFSFLFVLMYGILYHFCIHHLYILNVVMILMILMNYYAYYDDSIPMIRIKDQHTFL